MWRRRAQFFGVLLFVGFVAACGVLPKPFAPAETGQRNALVSLSGGGAVRVSVGADLPQSLAKPMTASMIKSLWAENVPASAAAHFRPRYLVQGRLEISYPSVFDPEQISLIWTLLDARRQKIEDFDLKFSGDRAGWLFRDKAMLNGLIAQMGQEIAQRLYARQKPGEPVSQQSKSTRQAAISSDRRGDSAVFEQKPKIFLRKITGAPGDGNNSLHRNLTRFLAVAGLDVVSDRLQSTYLVEGIVKLSPPENASNDVVITWFVTTKDGRELGKVTQNNKVPVGALAGRWGDVAHIVAQGGSVGIVDLIDQHLSLSDQERRIVRP